MLWQNIKEKRPFGIWAITQPSRCIQIFSIGVVKYTKSSYHSNYPLRIEVYICHQNQNEKNIGNLTTLLKPHNIGTHLKGIILVIWRLYWNPITLVLIWKVLRQAFRSYHYFWNPSTFGRVMSLFFSKYLQSLKCASSSGSKNSRDLSQRVLGCENSKFFVNLYFRSVQCMQFPD
jgi:hypothetical protein